MAIRRSKKLIVGGWIAVATIAVTAVAGDLVARHELDKRIATVATSMPGVSLSLAGGPALLQLASGHLTVQLAVSDSALSTYVACRTDQDLTVHTVDGGLVVSTERSVRGMTLPIEILLVPRHDGDRWELVADSVSAAGVSVPAKRALKILRGKGGSSSTFADRLLGGIPLPTEERLSVTSVRFTQGEAQVMASTSTHPTDGTQGGGLGGLRECLESQEG